MEPSKATKKEVVTAFRTKEILSAARRLMGLRGLEALTMEEIAAAAGVAKGTIYLYFQGKEDLIQALVAQTMENLVLGLEAIVTTAHSPREKLQQAIALLLGHLERERIFFPIYIRDLLRVGRKRRFRELDEKFTSQLARLFAEGIDRGQFIQADPRLLSFLLRGLVRAVGYYQLAEGREDAMKEALPVLSTLIFSGLLQNPHSSEEVPPA